MYNDTFIRRYCDIFNVVERVVDVESQFGDYAQLVSHSVAKLKADALAVLVESLYYFAALFRGEYAQVCLCNAEVGAYSDDAH